MSERMERFEARCQGSALAPHPSAADRALERIRHRNELCRALERICPDAPALAGEAIAALDEVLDAAEFCGNRTPKELGKILRGEDPITGEDVARLAIQAPAALLAWLAPILRTVAHGAPMETLGVLMQASGIVDDRLQQTREQLAGVDELAQRVKAWKEKRS